MDYTRGQKIAKYTLGAYILFKITRALLRQYCHSYPGPKGIPFLGLIPAFVRYTTTRHEIFHRLFVKYGPFCVVTLGAQRTYVVSDGELISAILKDTTSFPERPLDGMTYYIPKSLLTLPTEAMWKFHRGSLSALFTDDYLKGYMKSMKSTVNTLLLDKLTATGGAQCDTVSEDVAHLTMEILAQTVMGFNIAEFEDIEKEEVTNVLQFLAAITPLPRWCWSWFPIPGRFRAKKFLARMRERAQVMMDKARRKELSSSCMLSYLASLPLSNQEAVDEALCFMAAGHETTANTLTFALHALAHHPECQEAIYNEVKGKDLTYEDLSKLPFTYAVFREALRLYPTVPFTARTVPFTTNALGYRFDAGSIIIINIFSCGKNETAFPNPDAFDPSRWSRTSPQDMYNLVRSFGGGQRQCVGKRFAEQEALLVLAMLLQKFTLAPVDPVVVGAPYKPIQCSFGITLSATNPVKLKFVLRK